MDKLKAVPAAVNAASVCDMKKLALALPTGEVQLNCASMQKSFVPSVNRALSGVLICAVTPSNNPDAVPNFLIAVFVCAGAVEVQTFGMGAASGNAVPPFNPSMCNKTVASLIP